MSWGAAPATPALLHKIMATFPGAMLYSAFGQTETSPVTTVLLGEDALRKVGSVGTPLLNVEVRVVDADMNDVAVGEVGEIVYRGPTVMKEYWGNSQATEAAFLGGWFHSGDLVRQDEDGYIYVVDRLKDMIISGGENVYCAEVESAVADHPQVADVAVIGVADRKWGEVPLAVVVATDPSDPPTAAEIEQWCRQRLAVYKCPRSLTVVEVLPRNASGKVLKQVLRAQLNSLASSRSLDGETGVVFC
jgi:fatty-acyl-CoA synthase